MVVKIGLVRQHGARSLGCKELLYIWDGNCHGNRHDKGVGGEQESWGFGGSLADGN